MIYDLNLLSEMCNEMGYNNISLTKDSLIIKLASDIELFFINQINDNDCIVGFNDTPWHTHGDVMFSDKKGYHIEMDALNIIQGLKTGSVLICEEFINNKLQDRYLVHNEFIDEFRFMDPGEEKRIKRII